MVLWCSQILSFHSEISTYSVSHLPRYFCGTTISKSSSSQKCIQCIQCYKVISSCAPSLSKRLGNTFKFGWAHATASCQITRRIWMDITVSLPRKSSLRHSIKTLLQMPNRLFCPPLLRGLLSAIVVCPPRNHPQSYTDLSLCYMISNQVYKAITTLHKCYNTTTLHHYYNCTTTTSNHPHITRMKLR